MSEKQWGLRVIVEQVQLRQRQDSHLEVLKAQVALRLAAEDRRERAQRLGIDWKIVE